MPKIDETELTSRRKVLQRRKSRRRTATATSVVAIMTISFYLIWTPYAIVSLMGILGAYVPAAASVLALLFAKLGVIGNPIIYIFFNKEVTFKNGSVDLLLMHTYF